MRYANYKVNQTLIRKNCASVWFSGKTLLLNREHELDTAFHHLSSQKPKAGIYGHMHYMDRPGVHQVPEGSGEQGNMEETGCEIICGAPTTLAVKG